MRFRVKAVEIGVREADMVASLLPHSFLQLTIQRNKLPIRRNRLQLAPVEIRLELALFCRFQIDSLTSSETITYPQTPPQPIPPAPSHALSGIP